MSGVVGVGALKVFQYLYFAGHLVMSRLWGILVDRPQDVLTVFLCCLCSVCVPLHPGLHDGLYRDPTGGQWKPGVHSGGPRAAAVCFPGQYD